MTAVHVQLREDAELGAAFRRLQESGVGIRVDWDAYLYRVWIGTADGEVDWEIRRANLTDALNELTWKLEARAAE